MIKRVKKGGFCCYCKRSPLLPSTDKGGMAFTHDHIYPRALSRAEGNPPSRKVPCCRKCNGLKGDLHPDEWFWFIEAHPVYWRDFRTWSEVALVIARERTRRAVAGEAPIVPRKILLTDDELKGI